jgi:crotonobetainyl-CoA:carnitine CoA-transferase CaiB-like acyl-CoA transferase
MGTMEQPGALFSLSATPAVLQGAPPIRGQHTAEILRELGYSDARIADLQGRGATFVAG